jgi:hypothetical protein
MQLTVLVIVLAVVQAIKLLQQHRVVLQQVYLFLAAAVAAEMLLGAVAVAVVNWSC